MGNAGVALDIAGILRKLGHDVEVVEQLMDMEEAQ
jgi:pyruvate/2-oxoglutarate dehydrogenase complex dihydrolipoamide dehydrogenase (E3) component